MRKKLTNSEAKERILQAHNGEIELIGPYTKSKDKHHFRCKQGHEWWTNFSSVANNGIGCKTCSYEQIGIEKRFSTDEAKEKVKQAHNGEIELIGPYTKSKDKHHFRCKQGHEWWTNFNNVASGRGCPKCSNKYAPTSEEYREEAISLGYEPLEEYKGALVKIRHKCLECNHVWGVQPSSFRMGRGCPKCSNKNKAENLVEAYLQSVYPNQFQAQKRFNGLRGVNGGQLSFDFHLEIGSNRYLIEIQGIQHYKPNGWNRDTFHTQQEHDLRKYEYARNHNYIYIAIPNTCSTGDKESVIVPFLQNAIWLSETFGIQSHGFHLEDHLECSSDTQEITQTTLF